MVTNRAHTTTGREDTRDTSISGDATTLQAEKTARRSTTNQSTQRTSTHHNTENYATRPTENTPIKHRKHPFGTDDLNTGTNIQLLKIKAQNRTLWTNAVEALVKADAEAWTKRNRHASEKRKEFASRQLSRGGRGNAGPGRENFIESHALAITWQHAHGILFENYLYEND